MVNFVLSNFATIVVATLVVALVIGVSVKMYRDYKQGKNACGCNCANCPSSGYCHK
ncbi:MAG: FeoB-associated Cys-rich membrane protein [Acidaminococcaceae bacterium]